MSTDRLAELNVAALRTRLYSRDGLEGDKQQAERAMGRAMAPSLGPDPIEARYLREVPSGGRRRAVSVKVGDRAGASVVLEFVGRRGFHRIWKVSCGGCGKVQIRTSGDFNFAVRQQRSIACPDCLGELRMGVRMSRAAFFVERAREGGPVWTAYEIMVLQQQVLSALEENFGPVMEAVSVSEMVVASGYPWSVKDRRKGESDEQDEEESGDPALGNLALAVASGDPRSIQEADSRVIREQRRKEHLVKQDERRVFLGHLESEAAREDKMFADDPGCYVRVMASKAAVRSVRRYLRCRQRFVGTSSELACSPVCHRIASVLIARLHKQAEARIGEATIAAKALAEFLQSETVEE